MVSRFATEIALMQAVLSIQSQRRHLQNASMNSNRPERPEGRYRRQIGLKAGRALRELLGKIRLEPGTDGSRRCWCWVPVL
jgi:hypothetical protein